VQWPVKADWLHSTREKRDAATPAMLIKRISSPRIGNRRKKKQKGRERKKKKKTKKLRGEREAKREREREECRTNNTSRTTNARHTPVSSFATSSSSSTSSFASLLLPVYRGRLFAAGRIERRSKESRARTRRTDGRRERLRDFVGTGVKANWSINYPERVCMGVDLLSLSRDG